MEMNLIKSRTTKTSFLMVFVVFTMVLSGCSSDYLRDDYRRPSARVATKIPEIRQQTRQPKAPIKKVVTPYKPQVKKYTITSSTSTVTAKDAPVINPEILRAERKKQAIVDIDPYASIPENSSNNRSSRVAAVEVKPTTYKTSPAVKSLMMRARADLAIGNSQSAISKLERGLRIESQNPSIWHLLAKAQYDQANHQQAITMAKKSIRYSNNDNLISQNWKLIQKAAEKSGDTIAIKEALDYFKVHP